MEIRLKTFSFCCFTFDNITKAVPYLYRLNVKWLIFNNNYILRGKVIQK